MLTKSKIIEILANKKAELNSKYNLKSIALFGSYAREDYTTDSDIDIMVEFEKPVGMKIVDLVMELEQIFKKDVDLVSRNAVKARMLPYIEKDLTYV